MHGGALGGGFVRQSGRELRDPRALAHAPLAAAEDAADAVAGDVGEAGRFLHAVAGGEFPDNGAGERMRALTCEIEGGVAQGGLRAGEGVDFLHLEFAGGEGAGFIQRDGVHPGEVFDDRAAAEDDAGARAAGDGSENSRGHAEH